MNVLETQLSFSNEVIGAFYLAVLDAVQYFRLKVNPGQNMWNKWLLVGLNPKTASINVKSESISQSIKQYLHTIYSQIPQELKQQLLASQSFCANCNKLQLLPLLTTGFHLHCCESCKGELQIIAAPKLQLIMSKQFKVIDDSLVRYPSSILLFNEANKRYNLVKYFAETDQYFSRQNNQWTELNKQKFLRFLSNPSVTSPIAVKLGVPICYFMLSERKNLAVAGLSDSENQLPVFKSFNGKVNQIIDTKDENFNDYQIERQINEREADELRLQQLFFEKAVQCDIRKSTLKYENNEIDDAHSVKIGRFKFNIFHLIILTVAVILAIYNFISLAVINAKLSGSGLVLDRLVVRNKMFVGFENLTNMEQTAPFQGNQMYVTQLNVQSLDAENLTVQSQYIPGRYELSELNATFLRAANLEAENTTLTVFGNFTRVSADILKAADFSNFSTINSSNVICDKVIANQAEISQQLSNLSVANLTVGTLRAENISAALGVFLEAVATNISALNANIAQKLAVNSGTFGQIIAQNLTVSENLTLRGGTINLADNCDIRAVNSSIQVESLTVNNLATEQLEIATLSAETAEITTITSNAVTTQSLTSDTVDIANELDVDGDVFVQKVGDKSRLTGVDLTVQGQCTVRGNLEVLGTITENGA